VARVVEGAVGGKRKVGVIRMLAVGRGAAEVEVTPLEK